MKSILTNLSVFLLFISLQSTSVNGQTTDLKPIVGEWEVWIPGAVNYISNDASVYRVYTPGAPMNKLLIKADASYTWGDKKGNLKSVKPWHAQDGRAYYQISDKNNNTYDFWYKKETDQLIVLFGEVGGHAATGTRWSATKISKENTGTTPQTNAKLNSQAFKVGEQVSIEWSGVWYQGKILEISNGKYKVHYDGWGSSYDEWVLPSRLRKLANK